MNMIQIGYYCLIAGAFFMIGVIVFNVCKVQRETEAREDEYMRSVLTPEQYENYLLRKEIRKAANSISSSINTSNSWKL